jgi:hypothetical protein
MKPIVIRIICRYCGADNHCAVPVTDYKKSKNWVCLKCDAFLFEIFEKE